MVLFSGVTPAAIDQDPDKDLIINLLEYTFGLDPMTPENKALVEITSEMIDSVSYISFTFPPISTDAQMSVNLESNDTLSSIGWKPLTNGIDGVIISTTNEAYIVKVPTSSAGFNRLKVVKN